VKAYISVSYKNRKSVDSEIEEIIQTLRESSISSLVFVDRYRFEPEQEHEMMKTAMSEIDSCDLLIAEVSDKGIGIGVEVGYAKAKGKPVVYLRHQNAEHSTTVSGVSDFQVIYSDITDLKQKLTQVITKLKG
jgi:nucleoside 2-deoxyribosyltransferase